MSRWFVALALVLMAAGSARADLPLDITKHGLVYRHPDGAKAVVKKDLVLGDSPRFDLYLPPAAAKVKKPPVVVFVNGVGDFRGKLKDWEIYKDWAGLVTTRGYAAIVHEADPADPAGSVARLFARLGESGGTLGIDHERIAVWSCSANVTVGLPLVMDTAPKGVRAAVIYYGTGAAKTLRKDLPVFWVLAGRDGAQLIAGQRELWKAGAAAGAPWTMVDAPALPHAFDAVDAGDESRRTVAMTLAFLDAQLGALPPAPPPSQTRDILAASYGQDEAGAESALTAYVAANPSDPGALRELAMTRLRKGDCAGAAPHAKRLAELKVEDARLLASMGACELAAKRWDAGREMLERAFGLGARSPDVKYNLACAYAQLGRSDDALAALEQAVGMGFRDGKAMAEDPDLAPIRAEGRFKALVVKLTPP